MLKITLRFETTSTSLEREVPLNIFLRIVKLVMTGGRFDDDEAETYWFFRMLAKESIGPTHLATRIVAEERVKVGWPGDGYEAD